MDITLDGVEDIVTAMFNSTIIVYNGLTFEPIWNYTIPNSEVISIPIPGYYNDDDIPDFMVKHQIGSGFPTYYYSVATIIDGKTGKPLLEKPIEDSLSKEMSGLSITVEGFGNDWFLHWSVDCLNYEGVKEKYQFLKSEDLVSESRVDLCKLRFNSTLTTTLYALSQHVGPPGISLYFSVDWKSLEYNNSIMESYANIPFISERSPKIDRNQNKDNVHTKERKDKSGDMNNYFEPYGKYITNKKLFPMDSQSDNVDNFNRDYNLQNENKWINSNVQENKDYDMVYDANNNINIQEERSINYSQVNKKLGRTSNINNRFIYELNTDVNKPSNITNRTNVPKQINNYFTIFDTANNKDIDAETMVLRKRSMNILQDNMQTIIRKKQKLPKQNKKTNIKEKSKIKLINKLQLDSNKYQKKREINSKLNKIYPTYGVQKQPPTGILLPSILQSKGSASIDLVFSTFWLPSSDIPIILIQEDLDCIHRKKMLSEKKLQYEQNDDIVKECLNERGVDYKTYQEASDKENFKISLGQMTIYRIKLECICPEDMLPNQSCKNISSHQSWSEYLGLHGNGYFKPLYKANTK